LPSKRGACQKDKSTRLCMSVVLYPTMKIKNRTNHLVDVIQNWSNEFFQKRCLKKNILCVINIKQCYPLISKLAPAIVFVLDLVNRTAASRLREGLASLPVSASRRAVPTTSASLPVSASPAAAASLLVAASLPAAASKVSTTMYVFR